MLECMYYNSEDFHVLLSLLRNSIVAHIMPIWYSYTHTLVGTTMFGWMPGWIGQT